ncbi:MAG: MFS transporter [Spirochaetaceae bacterium]|jgi:MFS family permease|nr:MFS transporter [Spirochaetaceae bacterium]
MTKTMTKGKLYVTLFFLAFAQSAIYTVPYIRTYYGIALQNVLGVGDSQLGMLLGFYTIVSMIGYIPGGILVDKWDYKKCILIACFGTGLLAASYGVWLNYTWATVVYIIMGFTGNAIYWSATIKAVRLLGNADNQGKMYGVYYGFQGGLAILFTIILQIGFTAIARPDSGTPNYLAGMQFIFWTNAACLIVAGIVLAKMLQPQKEIVEQMKAAGSEASSFNAKMVGKVLKQPLIWLIIIMVFCSYGIYSNSFYYSYYLAYVKGISQFWATQTSMIRVSYMMCIGSFIGGFAATKLKSTTKWYIIAAGASLLSLVTFLVMRQSGAGMVPMAIMSIFPSAFILLIYTITNSLYQEYNIPVSMMGTAVGIVSIVAFTPDLFWQTMLGSWLDKTAIQVEGIGTVYTDPGFTQVFTFFAIVTAVGVCAAIAALVIMKKKAKQ